MQAKNAITLLNFFTYLVPEL